MLKLKLVFLVELYQLFLVLNSILQFITKYILK